jgi:hypothetical protein
MRYQLDYWPEGEKQFYVLGLMKAGLLKIKRPSCDRLDDELKTVKQKKKDPD